MQFGFVKGYIVWKFHGELEVQSLDDACVGGNSLTTTTATLNNGDQQNSEALASGNGDNAKTGGDANAEHDYITMADLLQDTSDDNNEDGGDVDEEALKDLDTTELFEAIANRHDNDDVLFGSPRWLENFREMK
jgi:hypothetical protein